ncbi:MAG: YkgJ family cysteine cluster protein [Steroidobacteraceae bacterium]
MSNDLGDNAAPMNAPSNNNSAAPIAAGPFGQWLQQARAALRGNGGMDVPCGDCVGCCTSHYSILLRPHDAALDIVPVKFLSSVPGLFYPHAKMNPMPNGHCPMFQEGRCSIYAQRPQTCLDYDCRVFAAAGIPTGDNRPTINQRIKQWRFTYESAAEQQAHAAVQAAATFINEHSAAFPAGWLPDNPSGIAVLAVKVYELFLSEPMSDAAEMAEAIVKASRAFDAAGVSK